MVSGTMAITRTTLYEGKSAIEAQRGTQAWGANWVFNPSGSQNDLLVIAEEFKNLSTSGAFATDAEVLAASGAAVINASGLARTMDTAALATASGTATYLVTAGWTSPTLTGNMSMASSGTQLIGSAHMPLSGIVIHSVDTSVPMKIVMYSNGLVSGVAI